MLPAWPRGTHTRGRVSLKPTTGGAVGAGAAADPKIMMLPHKKQRATVGSHACPCDAALLSALRLWPAPQVSLSLSSVSRPKGLDRVHASLHARLRCILPLEVQASMWRMRREASAHGMAGGACSPWARMHARTHALADGCGSPC